ncbi:MAG: HAD family phosphatase [Anaerolineaceae bacterium]|nr:HAD family phosphatase [Anaerolineaceae bacterium]
MNDRKRIRAVIWDMGGVILRTEDQGPRIELAKRMGIPLDELYSNVFNTKSAKLAEIGKISEKEHWSNIQGHFGFSDVELAAFQDSFWSGDAVDAILVEFIHSLRPVYETCLLSNAWSGVRKIVDQRFHLLDLFDFSVFSAEIGIAKPDPDIYLYALEKIGVTAAETIFIDDFMQNVDAAKELGIYAILFRNRDQVLRELHLLLK